MLAKFYKEVAPKKKLEIVFISSDKDQKAFDGYYKEHPWLAVPYEERPVKTALAKMFEVRGIPSLILLDARTGELITKKATTRVMVRGYSLVFSFSLSLLVLSFFFSFSLSLLVVSFFFSLALPLPLTLFLLRSLSRSNTHTRKLPRRIQRDLRFHGNLRPLTRSFPEKRLFGKMAQRCHGRT